MKFQLQEAFAAGLIKPGLNTVHARKKAKKDFINNVQGLRQKMDEFSQSKLPWIERLDVSSKPAPLAPELAYKEDQHQVRVKFTSHLSEDIFYSLESLDALLVPKPLIKSVIVRVQNTSVLIQQQLTVRNYQDNFFCFQKEREKALKQSKSTTSLASDPVHNDFVREMLFYRQVR